MHSAWGMCGLGVGETVTPQWHSMYNTYLGRYPWFQGTAGLLVFSHCDLPLHLLRTHFRWYTKEEKRLMRCFGTDNSVRRQ